MSLQDYQRALKLGKKEQQTLEAKGEDPYLIALDNILPGVSSLSQVPLGTFDIQLDQVAGTMTDLRRASFSRSFWPLLAEGSEFATKWISLSNYHVREGIQEPIKVYEYMNSFYVLEGHKRVSVLQYYGATTVYANVIRLLPHRTDEPENKAYFEFLDFYKQTRVSYIVFHDPGKYGRLLKTLPASDFEWSDDMRRSFSSETYRFRKCLAELPGAADIDRDEALLRYLELYGFEHMQSATTPELRAEIETVFPELKNETTGGLPELLTEPAARAQSKSFISKIIKSEPKRLKIAFLHDKTPGTSYWTNTHEQGRMYVQQTLSGKIETASFYNMLDEDCFDRISALVKDCYDVIFTTTPRLIGPTLRAAARFPDVKFLNCSLNIAHPIVRNYYGRIYEAKFLTGALAAAMSTNGKIGYLCNYPIYGMPAAINAFAIGAKMVNPESRVFLEWSSVPWVVPRERFEFNGVSVISGQDTFSDSEPQNSFGLHVLTPDGSRNVALSVWNWGKFYELIINSILDGSWSVLQSTEGTGRSINYWWGLAQGVVEVLYSSSIPHQTLRMLKTIEAAIAAGKFNVFEGPVHDSDGQLRIADWQVLSPREIITMDYLADNVVGSIPPIDILTPEAAELVKIEGVLRTDPGSTA